MADSTNIRLDGEAKEMLDKMAATSRPRVSLQALASQLIYDEWERRVSQPNPDITVEQAEGVGA